MTTLFYTTAHEALNSDLVYDVYYDAKTQEAHVSLQGTIYTYANVPAHAVDALVNAASIGMAFNGTLFNKGFKQTYGPGTSDSSTRTMLNERELATAGAATPKNLTYAADAVVDGRPVDPSILRIPPRISLVVVDEPVELPKFKHTVHFNSNGARTYALEASSVDEAVEELQQVASMLGVEAEVTGVFVHLV
jgi:hypothetical protein